MFAELHDLVELPHVVTGPTSLLGVVDLVCRYTRVRHKSAMNGHYGPQVFQRCYVLRCRLTSCVGFPLCSFPMAFDPFICVEILAVFATSCSAAYNGNYRERTMPLSLIIFFLLVTMENGTRTIFRFIYVKETIVTDVTHRVAHHGLTK